MTDATPSPAAAARAQQSPDARRVSRTRRALFAFLVTLGCAANIVAIVWFKAPVNDVTNTAEHVLADLGTMIGLAYIGGSVVDYSGMFKALGSRFGITIPLAAPGAGAVSE